LRIGHLTTSQRSCAFYVAWFFKCYQCGEQGWQVFQTPDGQAIIDQDAYFWQALETIARKLNEILAQERWKAVNRKK
jgi:hypothetical protein